MIFLKFSEHFKYFITFIACAYVFAFIDVYNLFKYITM